MGQGQHGGLFVYMVRNSSNQTNFRECVSSSLSIWQRSLKCPWTIGYVGLMLKVESGLVIQMWQSLLSLGLLVIHERLQPKMA